MGRGKYLERFFALHIEILVLLEDSTSCDTSAYCSYSGIQILTWPSLRILPRILIS